jgi:uncharacterized phage protein gp47/JayE
MPSPDFTEYIQLSLYDLDPQDVFENARDAYQVEVPEWVPREGSTEVLLMEALGQEVAEGIFAINRLPDGIMEALLKLFGIERDAGSPPVASLTFAVAGTLGYTIPVGASARLALAGGLEPIIFTTDTELVIPPGDATGVVSATGDRFSADANNIAANTDLEFLESIISVESVELTSIITGGTDPEDDAAYFARGVARFSRLSETLVLPGHFQAYALENTAVERAFAIDNWDSVGGAPGDDPGHITVAVYGNGTTLSSPAKSALQAEMEALALSNLVVHVIDPTITAVNVTATVKALAGYDTVEVDTAVTQAVTDYLDPQTWGWGGTVRRFELASIMDQVEGVDYVVSITTPASDLALTGYAPLADAGTIAITVT